jgi:hypothetical protein
MQKSASAIEQIVEMIRTESIVPLTLEGASGETLDLQASHHACAARPAGARARSLAAAQRRARHARAAYSAACRTVA